jgi:hypothetical protein
MSSACGHPDGASVRMPAPDAPISRGGLCRSVSRARTVSRAPRHSVSRACTVARTRFVSHGAPCPVPAPWLPLHTYAHAGRPNSYSMWLLYMSLTAICTTPDLLLQHLNKTLATCVRINWNTCNIRMKHQGNTCVAIVEHIQHLDKTLATYVWNICNIRMKHFQTYAWNICNTHIKHVQHTSEAFETFETIHLQHTCIATATYVTSTWNTCSLQHKNTCCNIRLKTNETFATSTCNMCNIPTYFYNFRKKHLQTYFWNINMCFQGSATSTYCSGEWRLVGMWSSPDQAAAHRCLEAVAQWRRLHDVEGRHWAHDADGRHQPCDAARRQRSHDWERAAARRA